MKIISQRLIISLISTCILSMSYPFPVSAEDDENLDLNSLAASLGADKDHFVIPNYVIKGYSDDIVREFEEWMSPREIMDSASVWAQNNSYNGLCFGISTLEILCHNGLVSPSDIQDGAEKLTDITLDDKVNDVLFYYNAMQHYKIFRYSIKGYICNNSISDDCRNLISSAEKAMEASRYFSISYSLSGGGHAVAGIGIANGNWEYDGHIFNKCILTLDSNANITKEDSSKENVGFARSTCIYVNSETNEYYIPFYQAASYDETLKINAIIDDDSFLNSRSLFAEDKTPVLTETGLTNIEVGYTMKPYTLTAYNGDESTIYPGDFNTGLSITKNDLSRANGYITETYTDKSADKWVLETATDESATRDISPHIYVCNEKTTLYARAGGPTRMELSKDHVSIQKKRENQIFDISLTSDDYYEDSGYVNLRIDGISDAENIAMEYRKGEGFLLSTDGYTETILCGEYIATDENGWKTSKVPQIYSIIYSDDIMLKYEAIPGKYLAYIDLNNDGVFEEKVKRGDTNCDGVIDASDASNILKSYADSQTGRISVYYLGIDYTDYNNDGVIDSADASEVLEEYAKRMTEK